MEIKYKIKDHDLRNIIGPFPTYHELEDLVKDFNKYEKDCINAIIDNNVEAYQNNYIAMNQTYSLLNEIDKTREVSEECDLDKMQDRMYSITNGKHNWDNLNGK